MSFDDALKFVKEKRRVVCPNARFQIENNYDIDKINFKDIKWEC